MNWIQKIVGALIVICLGAMVLAQTYKMGQLNPNRVIYVTYAVAVELAKERQDVGYDRGFQACQAIAKAEGK